MQSSERDGVVFVRLFPGEDFYPVLEAACRRHSVTSGVFLSGIGQLRDFTLGYFKAKGDYLPKEYPGVYELLSLHGNIVSEGDGFAFHIHVVVGDEQKNAFGGHLISAKVSVTNEIVILKTGVEVSRALNEETGLNELLID